MKDVKQIGPWTVVGEDSADGMKFIEIAAGEVGKPGYQQIAHVIGDPFEDDLSEQDWQHARLIAAAPELLEALKAMSDDKLPYSQALSMSKAAIAKAEGRQ